MLKNQFNIVIIHKCFIQRIIYTIHFKNSGPVSTVSGQMEAHRLLSLYDGTFFTFLAVGNHDLYNEFQKETKN